VPAATGAPPAGVTGVVQPTTVSVVVVLPGLYSETTNYATFITAVADSLEAEGVLARGTYQIQVSANTQGAPQLTITYSSAEAAEAAVLSVAASAVSNPPAANIATTTQRLTTEGTTTLPTPVDGTDPETEVDMTIVIIAAVAGVIVIVAIVVAIVLVNKNKNKDNKNKNKESELASPTGRRPATYLHSSQQPVQI
jgi:hypothetical protein